MKLCIKVIIGDHSRLSLVLALFLLFAGHALAEPRDAETIVARNCVSCHTSGAGGAPRIEHEADWSALFDRFSSDEVVTNAYEGRGRMPARGFCNDCSLDDIARAIEVMLPEAYKGQVRPDQ